jgi:hypothetical protein
MKENDEQDKVLEAIASSTKAGTTSKNGPMGVFLMVLFAVFVAIDLIAIGSATITYRSLHDMQIANEQESLSLGPVQSAIRANDANSSIARGKGPEGDALVVVEVTDTGTYETRIYLHQGRLVEEYALQGAPYTPSKATDLGSSSSFSFTYDDGLLSISTDRSVAKVALRSVQGGA